MKGLFEKGIIHFSFNIGLLMKGLNALTEIAGGIALAFLDPSKMNNLIAFLSKGEILEDPNDWFMNYLITFGHTFSVSTQQFAMFYLLSHGIIKITVIFLLWKKKQWAYPLSVAVFIAFIIYQLYHYMFSHSLMLLLLTILDVAMIMLTILEYKRIKSEKRFE